MKNILIVFTLLLSSTFSILGCFRRYYDEYHMRGFYPTGMKYEGRIDVIPPGFKVAYLG
jgi:hypothetical protein